MEKTIKIGNKEFNMSSSAYTQFKYKNDTGRSLLQDLSEFQEKYKDFLTKEITQEQLGSMDEMFEIIFRIAFIMTNEKDSNQALSYVAFLKQLDNYFANVSWINEVVELAMTPFSGGVQGN